MRLEVVCDKNRTVTFSEIYYVPEMRTNLLSTEKLRMKGIFYRNDKQVLFTKTAIIAKVSTYQKVPHIQLTSYIGDSASNGHEQPYFV